MTGGGEDLGFAAASTAGHSTIGSVRLLGRDDPLAADGADDDQYLGSVLGLVVDCTQNIGSEA